MLRKLAVFLLVIIIVIFGYFQIENKKKNVDLNLEEDSTFNSNLLENIKYVAKDADGNEYIINAEKGEIDLDDSDIIFLENVKSLIKLKNSEKIIIHSDFGKYNAGNYDTIFSKNVVITYLNNKITAEYLDFSLGQERMIISKNVVFNNLENTLKADVIELEINTKDIKIFMYEENKKVNIKNKKYTNGNN